MDFVNGYELRHKKVKCPCCGNAHAYYEYHYPVENDNGYWIVVCNICKSRFAIGIHNPAESSSEPTLSVEKRVEDGPLPNGLVNATEIIEYNFDLNETAHDFNCNDKPIWSCMQTGENLETLAYAALSNSFSNVLECYSNAENYYLANSCPDYEFVIISLPIKCAKGHMHTATFYCEFRKNGVIQQCENEYLLADITDSNLSCALLGIFSKNDVMSFLDKLIIRWNLLSINILIACPFIGYPQLPAHKKMDIWNRLLKMLDPNKSILLTKPQSFNEYKGLTFSEEGLDYSIIEKYGLQNRLIAANNKKNDFHAKIYAGLFSDKVELLSGSANLVPGPSFENISFNILPLDFFIERYLNPLNLQIPQNAKPFRHWIELKNDGKNWRAISRSGTDILLPIANFICN